MQAPGQATALTYDFVGNLISATDTGLSNLIRTFLLDDLTNVAYIGQSNGDNLSVLAARVLDQHLAIAHLNGQQSTASLTLLTAQQRR